MTILDFLEIGTADFDTEIEKSDNNTRGFSIEPLKIYLDKLPEKSLCKKFNINFIIIINLKKKTFKKIQIGGEWGGGVLLLPVSRVY